MFNILLDRETSRAISLFFLITGVLALFSTEYDLFGIALLMVATWIMVISESIMLSKVQLQMQIALQDLSRKKEREVEQVLYFLQQSSIAASPFNSIDGAKKLCDRFSCASMVLSNNYQIIKANKNMHELLGWKQGELAGIPAYTINDPMVMSKVGEYASSPEYANSLSISSHYIYIGKDGKKHPGHMHATKIGVEGYFVVFYPDSELLMKSNDIGLMVK